MRRWEELRPELDRRGVEIVTICADSPEQIRRGRAKHGVRATMLSDADLRVTDLYNLRHERGIAPKPGMIVSLPIPTTFLVDSEGIVRWIDQSEDYQVRSQPDRVQRAIEEMFPDRTSS